MTKDFQVLLTILLTVHAEILLAVQCPNTKKFGRQPPHKCTGPKDPNLKPRSKIEKWITKTMWEDFFPHANQGWGNNPCMPYSYESFIIAARYFPEFGADTVNSKSAPGIQDHKDSPYTTADLQRRDVAAFFAHVVQETGENNYRLFNSSKLSSRFATECFYRGGFYQFFEGGPKSKLFTKRHSGGYSLKDGDTCVKEGRYCKRSAELDFWYPCKQAGTATSVGNSTSNGSRYTGCYFGRGPLQLSWNYNYGQFQQFLRTQGIDVDLLDEPNQLITKPDLPLAMLSALWFYMTPQPPKPSMHDIIMGNWNPGEKNRRAGYNGSVFGPTSLVINRECTGEDKSSIIGGAGENRRIKAFKWFCDKLGVEAGEENTLSCKDMAETFDQRPMPKKLSWQPDWANMWKDLPCDCAPAPYPGALPYYDPKFYKSDRFAKDNERNRLRCVYAIYKQPDIYKIDGDNSPCFKQKVRIRLNRWGSP
ncbi:chitinase class I domain-containing protein [Ditylenchus destructor]|nr:chitinase class I domain-containing protein [Ditylenchus destructor]